jgi:hypothetical protein
MRDSVSNARLSNHRGDVIRAAQLRRHATGERRDRGVATVGDALDDRATRAERRQVEWIDRDDQVARCGGEPPVDVPLARRLGEDGLRRAVAAPRGEVLENLPSRITDTHACSW